MPFCALSSSFFTQHCLLFHVRRGTAGAGGWGQLAYQAPFLSFSPANPPSTTKFHRFWNQYWKWKDCNVVCHKVCRRACPCAVQGDSETLLINHTESCSKKSLLSSSWWGTQGMLKNISFNLFYPFHEEYNFIFRNFCSHCAYLTLPTFCMLFLKDRDDLRHKVWQKQKH